MGLSLVCHETFVAIKTPLTKDAMNCLGKTTIELTNWTATWGSTEEVEALSQAE
jgi:hypothetical protein